MKIAVAAVFAVLSTAAGAEPFILVNDRLFIAATINGHKTEALLDSAAEASIIDPKLAEKAGLGAGVEVELKGSGGTQKAHFVSGVTVGALGVTLSDREMVVSNLADVSERLIGRPTPMIIGREIFDAARLRIDFENRDVRTLAHGEATEGIRSALTTVHGVEAIDVRLGPKAVKAEVDIGNGSMPLVARKVVDAMGLKSVGRTTGGGLGGSIERDIVRLPDFELAGRTHRGVLAAVDDLPNAGELNIGTSILKQYLVTADFAGRSIYLAPLPSHGERK